jgi:hypothetical protein
MVQTGQDLAFMAEAEEQIRGIHAGSDELEGSLFLELGIVADGQVDHTHAAAADLTADPPGTESRANDRIGADYLLSGGFEGQVDVVRMATVGQEQRIDIPAEIGIAPASAIEEAMLFGGGQVGGREEHFLNLFPVMRHGWLWRRTFF